MHRQSGKNKDDPNRFRFDGAGYYLQDRRRDARELFRELPEACDNTLLIAERIEPLRRGLRRRRPDAAVPVPEGETQESLAAQGDLEGGLQRRYGDPVPDEVLERVENEMTVIEPMGFSALLPRRRRHLPVRPRQRDPGRPGPWLGHRLASSPTRLGITELDPLEHGLLFERFLNPERINPPDVDLDFDDRQRDQMVRYVTEKYGAEYTAPGQHVRHDQGQGRGQGRRPGSSATRSRWATGSPRRCRRT